MSLTDTAARIAARDRALDLYDAAGARSALKSAIRNKDDAFRFEILDLARKRRWDIGADLGSIAAAVQTGSTALLDDFAIRCNNIVGDRVKGRISAEYAYDLFTTAARAGKWQQKLDGILSLGEQPKIEAERRVAKIMAGLTDPSGSTDPTLAEMKTQRAWTRLKQVLDQAGSIALVATAVQRLTTTQDPWEISAAVQEMPTYLQVHGLDDPDALALAVFAQVHPDLQEALDDQQRAQKLAIIVKANGIALAEIISTLPRAVGGVELLLQGHVYVDPTTAL